MSKPEPTHQGAVFDLASVDAEMRREDAYPLPAQLIRPKRGALHWMIDAAAATRLQGSYLTPVAETGGAERSHQ